MRSSYGRQWLSEPAPLKVGEKKERRLMEKQSILIVEDDHHLRDLLVEIFKREGHTTEAAASGQEALNKAKEAFFNLAFLDINLPDLSGLELIKPLKALHPDMALIVLTGSPSEETAVQALNAGAAAYLIKPITRNALLTTMEQVLAKQHLAFENRRLCESAERELIARRDIEKELRKHRDQLEEVVDERTTELRATILELEKEVSERKKVEMALRGSEEKYRLLFGTVSDAIVVFDAATRQFLDVNESASQLYGYPREEFLSLNLNDITAELEATDDAVRQAIAGELTRIPLRHHKKKDGTKFPVEISVSIFMLGDRKVLCGVIRDITERRHAEEVLRESEKWFRELSITDDLTGLFNSRHFHNQVSLEVDRATRYGHPISLLLIDIDNFKQYNDSYGHLEGDKVLTALGKVIHSCLRRIDSGYRYGGEEFTVILPATKGEVAVYVAERIRRAFEAEAFSPRPDALTTKAVSIGVTQYAPEEDVEVFMKRADEAMYTAKGQGKNRVTFLNRNGIIESSLS